MSNDAGQTVATRATRRRREAVLGLIDRHHPEVKIAAVEREHGLPHGTISNTFRLANGKIPDSETINAIGHAIGIPPILLGYRYMIDAGVDADLGESSAIRQVQQFMESLTPREQVIALRTLHAMFDPQGLPDPS